jgi:hypothetical protein
LVNVVTEKSVGSAFSPRKRLFRQCVFEVAPAAVSDRIVLL